MYDNKRCVFAENLSYVLCLMIIGVVRVNKVCKVINYYVLITHT